MDICCLDLEGVLTPEIWIAFAEATGIGELRLTTRDEPDYDKLMDFRIGLLRERGLTLRKIQDVIADIEPLPGARAFLDRLRELTQVIVVSDTFEEFAMPLMAKLGHPTLFCNSLVVDGDGMIVGHRMRCANTKLTTVRCLQIMGFDTIAAGDSHNDVDMVRASKAGFFFRTTPDIRSANPDIRAIDDYDELFDAIRAAHAA